MVVDFTQVETFKINFDGCSTYHRMGELVNIIENCEGGGLLAVFKTALKYKDELKVAAVYNDKRVVICDEDDLKTLIENYPKEDKK